jgi:hypothetical protein
MNNNTTRNFGLDLFRALAIVLVVLSHGKFLLNGTVLENFPFVKMLDGVDLFFVLSGFLIGGILLKSSSVGLLEEKVVANLAELLFDLVVEFHFHFVWNYFRRFNCFRLEVYLLLSKFHKATHRIFLGIVELGSGGVVLYFYSSYALGTAESVSIEMGLSRRNACNDSCPLDLSRLFL